MTFNVRNIPEPASSSTPVLELTPLVVGRFAAGTALMVAGLYYLSRGKKDQNVNKMITGAILSLLSVAVASF
jgi:hypothetical protein